MPASRTILRLGSLLALNELLDQPSDRLGQCCVNDVLACRAQHGAKRRLHQVVSTIGFRQSKEVREPQPHTHGHVFHPAPLMRRIKGTLLRRHKHSRWVRRNDKSR